MLYETLYKYVISVYSILKHIHYPIVVSYIWINKASLKNLENKENMSISTGWASLEIFSDYASQS